mmetsp:Transcript_31974/g.104819  ORF Transcript_31974/g.104819 Transcript_31974/m.104819 type:complete len:239 (-) Transcript_31974:108-824(-)
MWSWRRAWRCRASSSTFWSPWTSRSRSTRTSFSTTPAGVAQRQTAPKPPSPIFSSTRTAPAQRRHAQGTRARLGPKSGDATKASNAARNPPTASRSTAPTPGANQGPSRSAKSSDVVRSTLKFALRPTRQLFTSASAARSRSSPPRAPQDPSSAPSRAATRFRRAATASVGRPVVASHMDALSPGSDSAVNAASASSTRSARPQRVPAASPSDSSAPWVSSMIDASDARCGSDREYTA